MWSADSGHQVPTVWTLGAREQNLHTFESNAMWIDRIRSERRRLGLDKPEDHGRTTFDVLASRRKAEVQPRARTHWLPPAQGPLLKPRPRLGATSFEYGHFHVSHPDLERSAASLTGPGFLTRKTSAPVLSSSEDSTATGLKYATAERRLQLLEGKFG
ncbi:unnamed protein product [Polarella glacialis]|uniref:Uncharacterized protein n=1 Tax=Polarella glacialis TaxID=89957 RepID=A0A813IU48_POLGL|nr:unnamed protein product [Polarella glacialis]CAE8661448.1 unnamed protein product [Polarella glacialis]|mmetsp:Transcript_6534/g.10504  ORF Transcript_6534/g.10504 Transcript_6534/m.10504 type:complete len:158 (+) Transcript_6534:166-639(+)